MSWLSIVVLVLAGIVSTVAALAISAVIILVIGEALSLAYQAVTRRRIGPELANPG